MDGRYIRIARKNAGITQVEFADMLGVTQNLVSLWETNVHYPRLDTAIRMADILDCSIEELFTANTSRYSTKKLSLYGIGISMRNARKNAKRSARQISEETGISKTTITAQKTAKYFRV